MKTLQPNTKTTTIIPNDYFSKLTAEIDDLKALIVKASNRIESLEDELNSNTIVKESGFFDSIDSRKVVSDSAEIDSLVSKELVADNIRVDRVDSETINSDSFIGRQVKTNTAEFDELKAEETTLNKVNASDLEAENIKSNDITANNIKASKAIIEEAEIKSTIIPSLALNDLSSNKASIVSIESDNIKAESIESDKADLIGSTITTLTNGYRVFNKANSQEIGTSNNEPFYVKLPKIENGSYRVVLTADNEIVASIVVIDSGQAPIVTYTKKSEEALTAIIYDDNITLESYLLNGILYYSSDDYENTIPPTFSHNKPNGTTYNTTAEGRVVILGDETAYFGLDVLGSLKASIFVDSNKMGSPLFYSGNAIGLISQLNTYLPKGSISVSGYVYDDDTSYSIQTITRNDDNSITCFIEDSNGVGTNSFDLTIDTPYTFGLFTTTFEWDKNVNS